MNGKLWYLKYFVCLLNFIGVVFFFQSSNKTWKNETKNYLDCEVMAMN